MSVVLTAEEALETPYVQVPVVARRCAEDTYCGKQPGERFSVMVEEGSWRVVFPDGHIESWEHEAFLAEFIVPFSGPPGGGPPGGGPPGGGPPGGGPPGGGPPGGGPP